MGIETIIAGGSALLGAGMNLFGGSDEQPTMDLPPAPKEYTQADLEKYGYKPIDRAKKYQQLAAVINAQKEKGKETTAALKFSQGKTAGVNDVWANTSDLAAALAEGQLKIDELSEEQQNQISQYLFQLNTTNQEQYKNLVWQIGNKNKQIEAGRESWWEKLLAGAGSGLELGTKMYNAFTPAKLPQGGDTIGGTGTESLGTGNKGQTINPSNTGRQDEAELANKFKRGKIW